MYFTYDKHFFGKHQGVEGRVHDDFTSVGTTVVKLGIIHEQDISSRMFQLQKSVKNHN